MSERLTDSRIANLGATRVHQAFSRFHKEFKNITRQAKNHFEKTNWAGIQRNSEKRLYLYKDILDETMAELTELLGERINNRLVWMGMKAVFSGLIVKRYDRELAETFFNSVSRIVFRTIGVDTKIEFVITDFNSPKLKHGETIFRVYDEPKSVLNLIICILADYKFNVDYEDIKRDAFLASQRITTRLKEAGTSKTLDRVEMVNAPFFMGIGAYLVGIMHSGSERIPLVLSLLHNGGGVVVDAVLQHENDLSVLFSYTRSYFHVDIPSPYNLVCFLKSILPRKRIAELYISIGYNYHGKTELYREFLKHTSSSTSQFEASKGKRGTVMMAFNMPDQDIVFKVIRDRFEHPKKTNKNKIMKKYDMVFKHDRVGRLLDVQTFEHLKFNKKFFKDDLIDELTSAASQAVSIEKNHIIINHCYVERRVTPLDIYLEESDRTKTINAVKDYGQAIKDLATSNLFPGDFILRNFGVTRLGRVVFYDYDEVSNLLSCKFRKIPKSRSDDEEFQSEPWYFIGKDDVFPEEFQSFLGLPKHLADVFMQYHPDLFEVDYWKSIQEQIVTEKPLHIIPYTKEHQLIPGRTRDSIITDTNFRLNEQLNLKTG